MNIQHLRALSALSAVAFLGFGCESSSDNQSGTWVADTNGSAPAAETQTTAQQTTTQQTTTQRSTSSQTSSGTSSAQQGTSFATRTVSGSASAVGVEAALDQIGYGSLSWRYGGVKGGGYKSSGVAISGLRASSGGLSFKYDTNLSAWGYGNGECGGYACMFVQTTSGTWVGGKFDWISSSRSSRDFKNVYSGYSGWNLDNVPNPCQIAFVILDVNSKRRSNVIVGTWNR